MKQKKYIGHGLSSPLELLKYSTENPELDLRTIAIHRLEPGRGQARRHFDQASLEELASSIQSQGILQPLLVRPTGDHYEIIAGERRWRASKLAGLGEIPCIVCDVDDQSAIVYGLIENIQRKNLNAIEEAEGLKRLLTEFFLTHEQIGLYLGCPRSSITNSLRLLTLTDSVKQLLCEGRITVGHAKVLLPLIPVTQEALACEILEKNLSVRETEEAINKLVNHLPVSAEKKTHDPALDNTTQHYLHAFKQHFALPVNLKINQNKKGRLQIHFSSLDELDELLAKLKMLDEVTS